MGYVPIKLSSRVRGKNIMGTMPIRGMNRKDDPQLFDTRAAKTIINYLVYGVGKMQKRPGQTVSFDTGEDDPIPVDQTYLYGYDIEAYGSKVRAYNNATGLFTNIKTNFTSDRFTGGRYGDYFFINTPLDGLWRIYFSLSWAESYNFVGTNVFIINKQAGSTIAPADVLTDSTTSHTATVVTAEELTTTTMKLTVTLSDVFTLNGAITGGTLVNATLSSVNPFTVGQRATGATSGAAASVLESVDSGATGSFVLGDINGAFVNGEIITDPLGGRALTTSIITFGIAQVTDAPLGAVFRIIGKRAIIVGLAKDESGYSYSNADTGTNPPFTSFTTGAGFNDAGNGGNRNGGAAKDAALIGNIIFVGQENGWYAFQITQTDLAGVSSKFDQEVATRQNFGVFRCVMTNVGMIVANHSGIWRMISLGQPNIPYSDQWECLTENLGPDYFEDVVLDNVDITYDPIRGFIFQTCGKSSQTNNLVLAIKASLSGVENDVKTGAASELIGWNIFRFTIRQNAIYGTSAVTGIRYNLFVGQKDVTFPIHSEYVQELNFALTSSFNIEQLLCKGELSPASLITVSIDTFDNRGFYEARRWVKTWGSRFSYPSGGMGWGDESFGESGWGNGSTDSGLVPDQAGRTVKLREISRAILRFESDDYSEHIINWFSADVVITKPLRNEQLQDITS